MTEDLRMEESITERKSRKQSEADKRYRASHKEMYRNAAKQYAKKTKATVLAAYGDKCICCGEVESWFLTIDHKNNDGAKHRRSIGKQNSLRGAGSQSLYRWLIKNNFPPEFQILCWNCNYGRRLNGGICPHGKKA